MDLNYNTVNIFPVPIHQFDVNGYSEIQDELIDYVYKMREKDPVGHTISNRSGWQSSCFSLENEDDTNQPCRAFDCSLAAAATSAIPTSRVLLL